MNSVVAVMSVNVGLVPAIGGGRPFPPGPRRSSGRGSLCGRAPGVGFSVAFINRTGSVPLLAAA